MKRVFLIILISITTSIYASDGSSYLRSLTERIEQMGSYRVSFAIGVGEESLSGEYSVDDGKGLNKKKPEPSYKLQAGPQTIYGNNKERRIYDKANMECIIESVDSSIPMIMSNPFKAFTTLDSHFSSTLLNQNEESITLELIPREEKQLFDRVILTLSKSNNLPKKLVYQADGDELTITINSFEQQESKTIQTTRNALDLSQYKIIDLR